MEALEQLKQMIENDNLKDGDYAIIMHKVDWVNPKVYRNFKHLMENYQKDADSIH